MDLVGLSKAEFSATIFKIQYYYTELEIVVIFIQFGILIRIRAVRKLCFTNIALLLHHYDMALHWLYIEEKNNIGIKAITTCANQAQYPDTVPSKKLFWLGDGWYCCMQVSHCFEG